MSGYGKWIKDSTTPGEWGPISGRVGAACRKALGMEL